MGESAPEIDSGGTAFRPFRDPASPRRNLAMAHSHGHDHGHKHDDKNPLTVEIQDLDPCTKKVRVEIPTARFDKELKAGYRDLQKRVPIPGFRPGKVPRQILEKRFGEALEEQVKQHLIEDSLDEALCERDLELMSQPELGDVTGTGKGEPISFEVTLRIRPQFELPELEGLSVVVEEKPVTEEEVDKQVDALCRTRSEYRPVEKGPVEKEDLLVSDLSVTLVTDSGPADEVLYTEEDVEVDLAQSLMVLRLENKERLEIHAPDLGDDMIGLEVGQTGEVDVTLPAGFPVDGGRGQDAIASLKVQDIKRLHVPELSEEWAKELGYDSVDDLRNDVRGGIEEHKELERLRAVEDAALQKVMVHAGPFDLPGDLVSGQAEALLDGRREALKSSGKSDEEVEAELQTMRAEARESAADRIREMFVLEKLAARERVVVTEEEVDAEIRRMAQMRGLPPKDLKAALEEQESLHVLKGEVRHRKTRALVAQAARVLTPGEAEEEYEKAKAERADEGASESKPDAESAEPAAATAGESGAGETKEEAS